MEYMLFPNKYKEWIQGLKILPSIRGKRYIQETGKGNVWQGKIQHKMSQSQLKMQEFREGKGQSVLVRMLGRSPSGPWKMDWIYRQGKSIPDGSKENNMLKPYIT